MFVWALVILGIEVLIAVFAQDGFVRPYLGDFLVVILLYCLLRAFVNMRPAWAAVAVLLVASGVELLQYFNVVQWMGLQHNQAAATLIGNTFDPADVLAYAMGTGCAWITDHLSSRKINRAINS